MKSTQKWNEGDLVEINLGKDKYCYAVLLRVPLVGFFRYVSTKKNPPDNPEKLDIIFKLSVYDHIVKTGIWPVVGKVDLDRINSEEPLRFIKDKISGEYFLYHSKFGEANFMKPATEKDVSGLEVAAVWDERHINDRLLVELFGETGPELGYDSPNPTLE